MDIPRRLSFITPPRILSIEQHSPASRFYRSRVHRGLIIAVRRFEPWQARMRFSDACDPWKWRSRRVSPFVALRQREKGRYIRTVCGNEISSAVRQKRLGIYAPRDSFTTRPRTHLIYRVAPERERERERRPSRRSRLLFRGLISPLE